MASQYTREQILDIVERQAQASNISREDFLRFAYIETGGRFDPNSSNPSGAKGLFQFMPKTARQYGLAGREFDPVENARAAADLYADNMSDIVRRQSRSHHDFLSGQMAPTGLDLYLTHQQGAAGYASIQSAIATGRFALESTRRSIINNISPYDLENRTGTRYSELGGMNDQELATTFTRYWSAKYAAIEIPERGIHATDPAQSSRERAVPLADGVLERGERGDDVRALQISLNQLGFRDAQGAGLETRSGIYGLKTNEAVCAFQIANNLEATGAADQRTREAIARQLALPAHERNRPQSSQTRQADSGLAWPTPGNRDINEADKPREGRGEFGTPRSGGRRHGGIDIQGDVGDPVVAVAGGTVIVRSNNGAAGNTVHVRHDDGTLTKYFHLDQFTVRDGQRVEAGRQIGTMGRTGNTPAQGDTHLHFEMWRNGHQADPMPYLQNALHDRHQNTASPTHPMPVDVLRERDSGPAVRELQQQLNRLDYRGADGRPLETTSGIYGIHTEHAVRQFQRSNGLTVDGMAGPETLSALSTKSNGRECQLPHIERDYFERLLEAVQADDPSALRAVTQEWMQSSSGQAWQQEVEAYKRVSEAMHEPAQSEWSGQQETAAPQVRGRAR